MSKTKIHNFPPYIRCRLVMADRSTIAPLHSHCCLGSSGQQGFQMSVLSSQHYLSSVILKPYSAACTFVDKLTAIWPDMSSKQGILRLFSARRDLAAIRPCVTPDACVFVHKCMKFNVVDRFLVLNKTARKVHIIRCIIFHFIYRFAIPWGSGIPAQLHLTSFSA